MKLCDRDGPLPGGGDEANHKVEVFSDGVSAKASDLLHQVALEDAKAPGNDRQHV